MTITERAKRSQFIRASQLSCLYPFPKSNAAAVTKMIKITKKHAFPNIVAFSESYLNFKSVILSYLAALNRLSAA